MHVYQQPILVILRKRVKEGQGMVKLICQGCKGTGINLLNSRGYCVCPKGIAKKAEDDLRVERYFDSLKEKK
jgi:hypothetical protein